MGPPPSAAAPMGVCCLFVLINFSGMFYILMIGHAVFAVGIMITLRAAFFAYIGASILGLVWALLVNLKPSRRSSYTFSILGISLILLGIFYTTRPHEEIVLAGTLEGKIGIVAGTPQSVTDIIRYGEFQNLEGAKSFKIRSMATTEQALTSLEKGRVSAIVIGADKVGNLPILWSTDYLSKFNKTMATIGFVLGGLSILLMAIGLLTNAHPLAVFSDFFVDTIRGIPMLVIILYVGLPLAIEFGKKYPTIGFDIDKSRINKLKRDLVVEGESEVILADTSVKLMTKVHQMCSGTIKFESGNSMILDLSKAEFIKKKFRKLII